MKILTAAQIKAWDQYTILNEPILSIDLMERASMCFLNWFIHAYPDTNVPVNIVCGNGNNGGDGLAVARLLRDRFYDVSVFIFRFSKEDSVDFDINLGRLMKYDDVKIEFIHDTLPTFDPKAVIIDGLLGTGANKVVEGLLNQFITHINAHDNTIISIDMPSGLPAEGICKGNAVEPDHIFTFQVPKLSFFLRENERFCRNWTVGNIGLQQQFLKTLDSHVEYIDDCAIHPIMRNRTRFQHKGNFGHALIVAGSEGKIGAAILAVQACLRAGVGLVTAAVPEMAKAIVHEKIPEAMVISSGYNCLSTVPKDLNNYTIGIGPGLGKNAKTISAFSTLISNYDRPMVIDADGLNIIASEIELLNRVPKESIITPHPKEFERLFGSCKDDETRHALASKMAKNYNIIIVLKGAFTHIFANDGSIFINSTGNPGMATAGSGDVLTGIITSLLAQKYSALEAAILGVYVHGLAGDIAVKKESHESLIASDIISNLGEAFRYIHQRDSSN